MKQMHLLTYLVFFILIASAASAFSLFGFCLLDCEEPAMQTAALNEPVQIEPQKNITEKYTPISKSICDEKTCNVQIFQKTKYELQEGIWEEKTTEPQYICNIKKLHESDPNVRCVSFNKTSITLEILDKVETPIPIKYFDLIIYEETYDFEFVEKKDTKLQFTKDNTIITLNYKLGDIIHIGENSTLVQLQDDENMVDIVCYQQTNSCLSAIDPFPLRYSSPYYRKGMIKWDISSIPSDQQIDDAQMCLYNYLNTLDSTSEGFYIATYEVYNYPDFQYNSDEWSESNYGTFAFLPSAPDERSATYTDYQRVDSSWANNAWHCFDVTGAISNRYDAGVANATIFINTQDGFGFPTGSDYILLYQSDYAGDSSLHPYLNITYSAAGAGPNNVPSIALISPNNNTAYELSNPHILTVNVSDTDSDPINMTFYNFTNSAAFCTNNSQTAGAQTKCGLTLAQGDEVKWYVNYTDNGTIYMSGIWNFSITSDTCTYGGSGDWNIDCADNCVISSSDDIGGNDIIITGEGLTVFQAKPTNYGKILSLGDSSTNICRVRLE